MRFTLFYLFLFFIQLNVFSHSGEKKGNYPFIENKGQWNEKVRYKTEVDGAAIFFENNAFHYQFKSIPNFHAGNIPEDTLIRGHVFKAEFIGSNENITIQRHGKSNSYNNYYLGNNKSKWQSFVHSYQEISYKDLYNGIDLTVYQKDGFLKYDYIVSSEASPNTIRVNYKGVERPVISEGKLVVRHSMGSMVEEKPFAYQEIEQQRIEVACNYVINEDGSIGFAFPDGYNTAYELIIDPVLIFSTYSGSFADNFGQTATYDRLGNGYMGGIADGVRYTVTLGAYQTAFVGGDWDIAITKFNQTGTNVIYSTYLGGIDNEAVHSLVVDDSLNLYLLGTTSSNDFPTTLNAFDNSKEISPTVSTEINLLYNQGSDIIVTKFNSIGSQLLGSTFFGGNDYDGLIRPQGATNNSLNFNYGDSHRGEIVIDSSGFCYIGTSTSSTNLDTTRGAYNANQDGLIVKFSTNLDSVIWSKYIGGSDADAIYSLKVIDSNKVLIGGGTKSFSDFPITTGSYLTTAPGGRSDGFIAIISADGNTIEKSTFIGTSDYDQVYFIEFDRFNNVYGYGQTGSGSTFPIKNAPKSNTGSGQFFVKLDRNLDSLEFSTTFGNGLGSNTINISPAAFLVDRCQNIYASGWGADFSGNTTLPNSMPLANNDPAYSITDGNDFYLYVLNRNADSVLYASFFGGSSSTDHIDGGTSRFDKNGIIYQSVCASCGAANTTDFPTTPNAYSSRDNSTNCNNALFKFDFQILIKASFSVSETEFCLKPGAIDSIQVINTSVGSTNTTWDFYGDTIESSFTDTTVYFTQPGNYSIRQVVFDSICAIGDFLDLTIRIRPDNIDLTTSFDSVICYTDSTIITAQSGGNANQYLFSKSRDFSGILNTNPTDSFAKVKLLQGLNKFYIYAENTITDACEKIDSVEILYNPTMANASISADSVCEGIPIQFNAVIQNVDTFIWKFNDGGNQVSSNISPSFLYPTPGNYTAQFEYENRLCDQKDTLDFNITIVDNDLDFSAPNDTLFCGTGVFNISVSSSGTINQYLYSSNPLFTDMLNQNTLTNSFQINQKDSAMYYVKISNDFCENTDSILVEYIDYQLALPPIMDSVCTPFSATLNPLIVGTDSFRITSSSGFNTSVDSTPSIPFLNQGKFNIQLIGSNARCGFRDTLSIETNVFNGVELMTIPDTLICSGDTIQLQGNSLGTAATFTWDDNPLFSNPINNPVDSTISVSPITPITYYLKAENFICNAFDTVFISTELIDIDVDDFTSFCIDDTIDIQAFVNSSGSPLSYQWTPIDSILTGDNSLAIEVSPKNDIFYYLETTSQLGCKDFDTIEVNVNLPVFNDALILADDDSLFKGQPAQLTTNRNGSNLIYLWEPAADLNDPTSPSPVANPNQTQLYKVTITDLNTGCIVVAFKRLSVFEINCGEPDIFIPTAFTPNNDLSNDILFIRGSNISQIDFQLFNRWGELVFETTDLNTGWDGTYKGKAIDPGVFAYQLRAVCFDGQEYYTKGNITLIR